MSSAKATFRTTKALASKKRFASEPKPSKRFASDKRSGTAAPPARPAAAKRPASSAKPAAAKRPASSAKPAAAKRPVSFVVSKPPTAKSTAPVAGNSETELRQLASEFKKSCEARKFRNEDANYTLAISRLAAAKKFSLIENVLEHLKNYDDIRSESFVARIISLYGQAGMFDHARKLFDEMSQLKSPRGLASFNSLLKAGLASKKFDSVVQAFNDLPGKASLQPDLISFGLVINALCKKGDLDAALSMLSELEKRGKRPDLVTFNTILDALYGAGRFSDGERIFASMDSDSDSSIFPDVVSYNARLQGAFGENNSVEKVVEEMERREIEPNLFTFNVLIKGYCERGDMEALKWYERLQRSGVAPNLPIYTALIRACCKYADCDMALEICLQAIKKRFFLKAALLKLVVDGLVAEDKADVAVKFVKSVNSANYLNYKLEFPIV